VVGASDRRGGPSKEEFNKKREKEGVGWVGLARLLFHPGSHSTLYWRVNLAGAAKRRTVKVLHDLYSRI